MLNNPLTYTDPSGYFIGKLFKKVFKGLNKALGDFAPFLGIALLAIPVVREWVISSWGSAFTFGFWTGGIASGSYKGALFGGISAAAFYGIGSQFAAEAGFFQQGGFGHVLTHGLAGGILAELQGGQFGHGFLAAGISKAVMGRFSYADGSAPAVMGRTAIAATVGGTISRMTGGKFANGALTSAMAQLFNAETAAARARGVLERMQRSEEQHGSFNDILDGLKSVGKRTVQFFKDRFSVTVSGVAAAGVGADASMRVNMEGAHASVGYATGLGVHARATLDLLVYDGGPVQGPAYKASGCYGTGAGGCITVVFSPDSANLTGYVSGGFVKGMSFTVRPIYTDTITKWKQK